MFLIIFQIIKAEIVTLNFRKDIVKILMSNTMISFSIILENLPSDVYIQSVSYNRSFSHAHHTSHH